MKLVNRTTIIFKAFLKIIHQNNIQNTVLWINLEPDAPYVSHRTLQTKAVRNDIKLRI